MRWRVGDLMWERGASGGGGVEVPIVLKLYLVALAVEHFHLALKEQGLRENEATFNHRPDNTKRPIEHSHDLNL